MCLDCGRNPEKPEAGKNPGLGTLPWVPCPGFFPQSKDLHGFMLIYDSKLAEGLNVSIYVGLSFSLCLIKYSLIAMSRVFLTSCTITAGIASSPPTTLTCPVVKKNDGWIEKQQ